MRVAGFPQGASLLTFTPDNIHQAELLAAITPCGDAELDKTVDDASPQPDLSGVDMTTFKVTWKQSTAGGIEPEWTQVSGPNDGNRLFHLLRGTSFYESFWNAYRRGDTR